MDAANYIKSVIAQTAFREERSNQINGILAVMFVIRNRVLAGWEHGDYLKVMTDKNQFDSVSTIGDSQTVVYGDPRDPLFAKTLELVDGVYDNSLADSLTDGALYYADLQSPKFQKGGWLDRNVVQKATEHPRTSVIGTTTYFK